MRDTLSLVIVAVWLTSAAVALLGFQLRSIALVVAGAFLFLLVIALAVTALIGGA